MSKAKIVALLKVAGIAIAAYGAYRRLARRYPQLAQIVEG